MSGDIMSPRDRFKLMLFDMLEELGAQPWGGSFGRLLTEDIVYKCATAIGPTQTLKVNRLVLALPAADRLSAIGIMAKHHPQWASKMMEAPL